MVKLGIIFGGKSTEHEVSVSSATWLANNLSSTEFEISYLYIEKTGSWKLLNKNEVLLLSENKSVSQLSIDNQTSEEMILSLTYSNNEIKKHENGLGNIDVFFPVMHGKYGEDGAIQGFLKLINKPFIGADILGSAVGLDKDVMKRLLRDANLPIANFLTFYKSESHLISFDVIVKELGLPFFVKSATQGSSIGVSKVSSQDMFEAAIAESFKYDTKIIIEEEIEGREIECSVIGNENPECSLPGEIEFGNYDFYSFDAKYSDPNEQVKFHIPPKDMTDDIIKNIQLLSAETYKVLCCNGLARVDLFLDKNNKLYVNEINTIPGFTNDSLFAKLWQKSGISLDELFSKLIHFSLEKFEN